MSKKIVLPFLLSFCFAVFAEKPFSVGVNSLFTMNFGTSCEEPELNSSISKSDDLGMDVTIKTVMDAGVNAFFRYNFPFYKNLGLEADFSYFNGNGMSIIFSDSSGLKLKYSYKYKSFEIEPLVTYSLPWKTFNFTFCLGPNFSIPIGRVEHQYTYLDETDSDFELNTHFVPGMAFGFYAGTVFEPFEFFIAAKYILDFTKIEYTAGGEKTDLLQRRCLACGFGMRIIFPDKH